MLNIYKYICVFIIIYTYILVNSSTHIFMCCVLGMGRKKALEGHPNGPNPMMDGQPDSCSICPWIRVWSKFPSITVLWGQGSGNSIFRCDLWCLSYVQQTNKPWTIFNGGGGPFPEYTILTRRHVDHLENTHHTKDSHLATSISSPKSNHWPFPEVNDTNILSLLNSSCKL